MPEGDSPFEKYLGMMAGIVDVQAVQVDVLVMR